MTKMIAPPGVSTDSVEKNPDGSYEVPADQVDHFRTLHGFRQPEELAKGDFRPVDPEEFEEIKADFAELSDRYDTDTKALQASINTLTTERDNAQASVQQLNAVVAALEKQLEEATAGKGSGAKSV